MDNLLDHTGKAVLVTGGSTGIGRAVSLAFARQGARVAIGDMSQSAEEAVRLIEASGGEAMFLRTDVTRSADVEALVARTVEAWGGLHCAFNNAGILPPTRPFAEQEKADFDRTVAVDLEGVFSCLEHELRHMIGAGGGAIVDTASIAGLIADPGMAPCVAAKHGAVGLTKAAALDHARDGIRVNALAPGLLETAMTRRWLKDGAGWRTRR